MAEEFTFEEASETFSFEDVTPRSGPVDSFLRAAQELPAFKRFLAAAGIVENVASMAAGFVTSVPATVVGATNAAMNPDRPGDAFLAGFEGTHQAVESVIPYRPETELGKRYEENIQKVFEFLPKKAGEATFKATGSPLLAAGAETAVSGIELAAPFMIARRGRGRAEEKPSEFSYEEAKGQPRVEPEFTFEEAKTAVVTPEEILAPSELTKAAGTDFGKVLEKINEPADVQAVLQNTIAKNEPRIEEARRGTISNVETEAAAKLLMTDQKRLQALMNRKTGEALNAESISAMSSVLKQATREMQESAVRARDSGNPADLLKFQKDMEAYTAIAEQFMGARAEAGRSLQIFSREMQASGIEGILDRFGGKDAIQKKAQILAELDTPEKIAQATKDLRKAKTSDVLLEIWINSLLSGLQTHATNIMSNTLTPLLVTTEQAAAGVIGKFHGGEKVYLREAATKGYAMIEGAREGLVAAGKSFATEEPVLTSSGKIEGRPKAITKEALGIENKIAGKVVDVAGQGVRLPGRFLAAEDEFFKAVGYRQELNALAVRQGMSEGLRGPELAQRVAELKSDPPEALRKRAWEQADEQTFNKELGQTGKAIQGIATRHPTARLIAPFIRTPINIVKFAGKRSPMAVLMKEGFWEEYKAGGARRDLALARVGVGSSIGAMTIYYASQGLITGGGPSDPRERAMLYQTGWKPYSIKIDDAYYSYSRLEPMGMLMGISADAAYVWDKMDKDEQEEYAALVTKSISRNLVSKTWLKGLTDAVNAYTDPDRYGEKWILNYAGTAVPTAIAQEARVQDPYLRRAENLIDKVKSRIPGLSEDLLPKLNLWGEPIKLEGSLGPDRLSPIYMSRESDDKVASEMVRLDMAPSPVDKKINGVELTPEQENEYITLAGQPAKAQLDRLVYTENWERIPDVVKKDLIDDVISRNRRLARTRMIAKYPDQLLIEPARKKANDLRKSVEKAP